MHWGILLSEHCCTMLETQAILLGRQHERRLRHPGWQPWLNTRRVMKPSWTAPPQPSCQKIASTWVNTSETSRRTTQLIPGWLQNGEQINVVGISHWLLRWLVTQQQDNWNTVQLLTLETRQLRKSYSTNWQNFQASSLRAQGIPEGGTNDPLSTAPNNHSTSEGCILGLTIAGQVCTFYLPP